MIKYNYYMYIIYILLHNKGFYIYIYIYIYYNYIDNMNSSNILIWDVEYSEYYIQNEPNLKLQ